MRAEFHIFSLKQPVVISNIIHINHSLNLFLLKSELWLANCDHYAFFSLTKPKKPKQTLQSYSSNIYCFMNWVKNNAQKIFLNVNNYKMYAF